MRKLLSVYAAIILAVAVIWLWLYGTPRCYMPSYDVVISYNGGCSFLPIENEDDFAQYNLKGT